MDDVERSQRLKLRNCGHIFCGECVAGTLKAALDDKKVDDRLRCPDTSCRKPLDVLDAGPARTTAATRRRGPSTRRSPRRRCSTRRMQMKATRRACAAARATSATTRSTTSPTPPQERSTSARSATGRFVWAARSSAGRSAPPTTAIAPMSCSRRRRGRRTRKSTTSGPSRTRKRRRIQRMRRWRVKGSDQALPQVRRSITKNHVKLRLPSSPPQVQAGDHEEPNGPRYDDRARSVAHASKRRRPRHVPAAAATFLLVDGEALPHGPGRHVRGLGRRRRRPTRERVAYVT